MSATPMRVALIGAGSMATNYHYPSLVNFADVELTAICDLVPEKAERAADRFHIPRIYADYQRMLAEVEPAAVYVLMPPQHLYEPALQVLKQGRHLFVEKPLALTTHQARMLAYTAGEQRCPVRAGVREQDSPWRRQGDSGLGAHGPRSICSPRAAWSIARRP